LNFWLEEKMAGQNVGLFTDDNFETEVVNSQTLVLIDFWAPWCGPCWRVGPIIEELANEYQGKLKVGKLNVDENQRTAIHFSIQSIPTVILVKGGEVKERIVGAVPKDVFKNAIDKHIA
jgi:thioredoxin 1